MKENIIEKLSDYEHDRWTRQINTNYDNLANIEKESDRKEALRILEILKGEIEHE